MPSLPRRLAPVWPRAGIAAFALLLVALALPGRVAAQFLELTQALAVEADTPRFPLGAPARLVRLPDDWAATRPRFSGTVWYRAAFDAPQARARDTLLGVYIPRACSNLEVYLNGHLVHVSGRMDEPVSRNCRYPQLVMLPAALLEPAANLLDIRVVGYAVERVASHQRAGGLSALTIGPHAALAPRHAWHHLLNVTLAQIVSGTLVLLGALMLVVGGVRRRDSHLAYFGALAIGWAVATARLWWRDPPLPNYDAELLLVSFMAMVTLAGVQFLVRYAGWRSRPIGTALYAQCVVVPMAMILAGPMRVHASATFWYGLMALEAVAAMGLYVWTALRRRPHRRTTWAVAALLAAVGVLIGLELVAQQRDVDDVLLALAQLAMPMAFVAMGLRLMQQYGRALQTAEAGRESLEQRVRDATAEIERSYAQLAELRVEQVTERERKRIAADLHDDLGAKLLTIVHTSESERISTLAREALEEMRLSVRGLTGKPVQLADALGDWRAEVVSRLTQAGFEAEWDAPIDDETPRTLTARAYVQTTRVLREAVNNIIKHSGATRCTIAATIADGDFRLSIQDNGEGIPLELDGRLDRGHGMASMKQRAKQLHGQCLVESGPGYGTVIRLTIPLDRLVEPT